MKKLIPGYILAIFFWFFMFSPWTAGMFNFWGEMLAATGILTIYSYLNFKHELKTIFSFKPKWIYIGLVSAATLYLVFFAGNYISNLMFDFAEKQVNNIYSTKSQAAQILIGISLLLWIGPAEEIFWRGFAQHKLSKKYGDLNSYLITSVIYGFVHIWSFNFMLIMAALICGLFWGWMYMKYKSVVPGIISHAVWDVLIFIIIPIS